MKLFIYIVYFFLSLFAPSPEITDEVVAAVKQGKSSEIVKYFEEKVSIKVIEQEDVLSKSQAEALLKFFFEKHPVKSFTSVYISTINSNSQYITGNLETSSGKFRVSILIKKNLVSQFRIETDND